MEGIVFWVQDSAYYNYNPSSNPMERFHKHDLTKVWEKYKSEEKGGTLRCTNHWHRIFGSGVWFGILILWIIPGTSHKLRSFWAGSYPVTKRLIALALAKINPVYFPKEGKLVSLDVLKLYRGEDIVCQNPEYIDPDQWLDKGELKEAPEIPREKIRLG